MKPITSTSVLNCTVSLLSSYTDIEPIDVNLLDYLTNDAYKATIAQIRATADKNTRSQLKSNLPAVMVSGRFSARGEKNLIKHSGLIAFDLDDVEDIDTSKALIAASPYVAYLAVSASGKGLFGIMAISTPERHKDHFKAIEQYIFTLVGLMIDPAPANVASLRGYSFDENAYFNHSPKVFTTVITTPAKPISRVSLRPDMPLNGNVFETFNAAGDIRDLLTAHGWQFLHQKGSNFRYCRPGKDQGVSADYCIERKTLYVFSSSTIFEAQKGYNNTWVFCLLACGGDFKLCRQKLLAMGYGRSNHPSVIPILN